MLLAMLVAEHRRPLSRDELAGELWGDDLPAAWASSLKSLISRLRSALTDVGLRGGELIRNAFGTYQFRLPAGGWVDLNAAVSDVHLAEGLLAAGNFERAATSALVTRIITERPFLPGADGAWAESTRRRLEDLRLRAIECMAESYLELGNAADAIRSAELAIELDALRESSWRILMRAHACTGNLGKALCAYEGCRAVLREQLGANPSPATRAVHQELLG
jgi:DNA-binding SARP family transcriptional activator